MAAIYEKYWPMIYQRCRATLGDEEAAADLTQEVFLIALDNFEQIQHDVVRGMMDIARTLSYERRRRPAREVPLADPPRYNNGHSDDPAEIAELQGVLDHVWSGLSPVERRYVADKFAGFSFEEIAKRNGRRLGTVSSNLFRAREHARSLRGPLVPAFFVLPAWRRFTELTHRARNAAHSSSTAAAAAPVQTLTLSLAMAGLLAAVSPALNSALTAPSPGSLPSASLPSTQLSASSAASVAPAAAGIAASAPGATVAYAAPASSHSTTPLLPIANPPASSETPEDTRIDTATPSPNYDQDHTIVGLGYGKSCACSVLLRSTDGGATWSFRTGAPVGDQVVLPPTYPRDSRIFVGLSHTSVAGSTNWWTPDFEGKFTPLPGPPGAIALSAAFDSGDPRVVTSAPTGVWSYNVDDQVLDPLVVETKSGVTPSLATPLGSLTTAVFAMTSSQAVTPGTVNHAIAPSTSTALWACPPSATCGEVASVPINSGSSLVVSPAYQADSTLVAYLAQKALLSTDRGRSFTQIALPAGTSSFIAMALAGSGSQPSMWLLAQRANGQALEIAPTPNSPWHEVDHGLTQITAGGRIVPLANQRVMFLSAGGGFLCTVDNGMTWAPRCPAA